MILSGLAALSLEMVWLRRLSLQLGSAGLSATITLAIYMGGLGIGAYWSAGYPWKHSTRGYGLLELFVAGWALSFPLFLHFLSPIFLGDNLLHNLLISCPLLLPPAIAHGGTLPALVSVIKNNTEISWLYAMNTIGAVLGVMTSSFVIMPLIGVRGTEIFAAACCALAGGIALSLEHPAQVTQREVRTSSVPVSILFGAGIAGASSMALEIIWSRLGALLIGGSVYAFALVLAVFLSGIAFGAAKGRKMSRANLPFALGGIGILAIIGCFAWRWLPHGLAFSWSLFGDGSQFLTGAFLLMIAMAGAPIASGMVFSLCLKYGEGNSSGVAGQLLTVNTIGGVLGVLLTGTYFMPRFGILNTTLFIAGICVFSASLLPKQAPKFRGGLLAAFFVLYALVPQWDIAVYATGLYNRIGEFVDLSPRAIEKFAHEGWDVRFYRDGQSASVAVGQSNRTGNIWLSINGKVDASTGEDMPTQILSGQLPVLLHPRRESLQTMVVGLASGVTANEARKQGANPLTVIELEPSIIEASHWFESVNDRIFENPDVTIRVADARAVLSKEETRYDIIISEPSNPWITGVSNLFTVEYWQLGRKRLHADGVFCQWVQLYALPPDAFRSLIASYLSVFPNTWLFETIPGSDALLISAPYLPADLPIQPTLNPEQLRQLGTNTSLNTDDKPWIEFEAPKWVNRSTGKQNQLMIEAAKEN